MRVIVYCVLALVLGAVTGYRHSNYAPQQSTYLSQRPKEELLASAPSSTTDAPLGNKLGSNSNDLPLTTLTDASTAEQTSKPTLQDEAAGAPASAASILESTSPATPPPSPAPEPSSAPAPAPGPSPAPASEDAAPSKPSISAPPVALDESDPTRRRIITYDQRQEGQYNVRADLENFMIVLIPPSPADGLSLLEQLSSLRRSSHGSSTKSKRKHYSSLTAAAPEPTKYRQFFKSNYLGRQAVGLTVPSPQPVAIVEGIGSGSLLGNGHNHHISGEFIEGRTPYHVDISASDDEHLRLHPDRQVDVLPPPFAPPLPYPHLIKPIHLETEPTVIQALPPHDLSANNLLETYNQILAASHLNQANQADKHHNLNSQSSEGGRDGGYYRMSRAISGYNPDYSNTSPVSNSLEAPKTSSSESSSSPLFRARDGLYPPIDLPQIWTYLMGGSGSIKARAADIVDEQKLDNSENSNGWDILQLPNVSGNGDDNSGNDFLLAKVLFSDNLERCAPGHRRDSYGNCRQIDGYTF